MNEEGMKIFRKLHDNDTFLPDDLEYRDIMLNYLYNDVYQHGDLNLKLRELILIVVNTTNFTLRSLKEHLIGGLKVGLTPVEIKEAIYQCTPYIGLGKVEEALIIVNEVFKEKKIVMPLSSQITSTRTRFDKGFEVQSRAFGHEHIQAGHNHAPIELKHIQRYLSEYCFGDFYTREGLDLKVRELITMVMLATLGGCENQLRAHIGANITVGNERNLLIETITQCQPYIGFPRTLNAINIINEVTNK